MSVVPAGPSDRSTPPALAVAFCPTPPLLIPEVEGRSAPETEALRRACATAVTAMLSRAPEVVVVVGAGAGNARFGAGDVGSLRGYGVDLEIPFDRVAQPGGARLPLTHTVGAWLLDAAGFDGVRVGVGPGSLAGVLAEQPGPVGILAMGDGSARRTAKAPGYLDPDAAPLDAAVSAALAAGDAGALARLDAADADRLLADGIPTWRAVGAALSGRSITGRLHSDDAPFGVGYLVADWQIA